MHLSRRARTRVAVVSGLLLSLGVLTLGTQAPLAVADDSSPASGSVQGAGSAGSAASVVPVTPDGVIDAEQPSSLLAKTPPSLLRSTDAAPVPVMIKYDYDAVASYTGTIKGLDATSPSVTGDELTPSSLASTSAVGDYTDFVDAREAAISAQVRKAVPGAEITGSLQVVYGGVSALVPGDAVADLLDVPGVVAVQEDAVNRPTGEASTDAVNPGPAYAALGSTPEDAGTGLLFGSLDSGIWPEHPSLVDDGTLPAYTGRQLPCEYGDNPQTAAVDVFECNDKVVGGETFLDTYTSVKGSTYPNPGLARDADGHGTHTTTTAAGDVVDAAVNGRTAHLYGVAPGAQVMAYRVCALNTCYASDSAAAVQQAILDGVDVLNFSVSGGTNPATDPVELAFLDAYNAGIFVATSGGNNGPAAATVNHLSPWVSTVAATTWAGLSTSRLTLTADNGDSYTSDATSSTAGAGPLPLVLSTDPAYNRSLCDAPAAPGTFTGKIVVCQRGTNARVEKGYNVLQGGAAGMVLANVAGGASDTFADNHWLPTAQVASGPAMMAFISGHSGITAEFTAGERSISTTPTVAGFSSRGPAGGFIKPDIAAPGVAVLAGVVPTAASPAGGPSQTYQNYDGTSMAAPHVAGSAILLRALHPDWTPGQIRSVLTTTGVQGTTKQDSAALATPYDVGTGRLRVKRAVAAPLTISDTGASFAALSNDPARRVDLNIPSINAPSVPGGMTTTRTVENVSSAPVTVTARRSVRPGTTIEISPRSTTVDPGESATFTITLTSTAPVDVQQFATIGFQTDQSVMRIPVAYVRKPSTVALQQSCDAPSIAVGAMTTCHVTAANESPAEVQVDLSSVQRFQTARISGAEGATRRGNTATTSATLAGRVYSTPSLESVPPPSGGFTDLTGAVTAQPIGDEQAITYTVPAVSYGGSTYTTLGVVSNGYIVLGGTTTGDVVFQPPTGPSAARPNNIVAPFWADLDGTGTAGIRVALVDGADGASSYVVVQWDVKVYGTSDARRFQAWLKVGGDQDVRFEYPAPPTAPAATAGRYGIGAENELGAGVLTTDLPTQSLRVLSSPSSTDSISYDVTVLGRSAGTAGVLQSRADVLDAGRLASRSIATTPIEVTP